MKIQKKAAAAPVKKTEKNSKMAAPASSSHHAPKPSHSAEVLTAGERTVLKVFRGYRMTAGHMLCFNGNDHTTHKTSLGNLIRKGVLREERFKGAYCLTPYGYTLMQAAAAIG